MALSFSVIILTIFQSSEMIFVGIYLKSKLFHNVEKNVSFILIYFDISFRGLKYIFP